MLNAPCYIVSDTHLGVASPQVERSFVSFLRGLAGEAASLVINGDLFDFWFEWKTVIPRRSFRALAAEAIAAGALLFQEARDSAAPACNIESPARSASDGIRPSALQEPVAGAPGWCGLRDREDRGYRLIRPIMRNRLAIKAFRMIHPDWASRLAHGSSNASRTYRARDEGRGLRSYAEQQLESAPDLDLLVYGHSHVAALERMSGGGVFANAGSWLDSPTYLRLTDEVIELRQSDGSPQGACLNSIDR